MTTSSTRIDITNPLHFIRLCWPDMKLYSKQRDVLLSVRENKETFVHAANELGKCVAIDERIQLADGRIVRAGDLIGRCFGVHSFTEIEWRQTGRLAWASDNGIKQVCRVATQCGRTVVRTLNHPLWAARTPRSPGRPLIPDVIGWTAACELTSDMSIAVPSELSIEGSRPVPDDHVKLLGYLLGDGGTTRSVEFTQLDGPAKSEFIEIVRRLGSEVTVKDSLGLFVKGAGDEDQKQQGRNPVLNLVRKWGLIGKKSKEKKFPEWVWELPNRQIALLLSRLFACDGYVCTGNGKSCNRQIGIALASKEMIEDVQLATLRLGIDGNVRHRMIAGKFHAWEWSCRSDILRFAEIVGIYGKEQRLAECVEESRGKCVAKCHKWRTRSLPPGYRWARVKAVERLGEMQTVAIQVDGTETFLTTVCDHNSRIAAVTAIWWFASRTPARVITSSTTQAQLETILWTEIRNLISSSLFPLPFEVSHLRVRKYSDDSRTTVHALDYIVGHVTNTVESFQGHHLPNDKARVLCVLDEASGIADEFKDAADSWAHRALVIGNPLSTTNFFYRDCKRGDQPDPSGRDALLRKVIHVDGLDSPNVKLGISRVRQGLDGLHPLLIPGLLSYDEYLVRDKEWDEVKRTTRLHGRFYEGEQAMLFPANWLDASQTHWDDLRRLETPRRAKAMGVDGAEGRDMTCWTIVDEHGIIQQVARQTPDTMEIVNETVRYMEDYGIAARNVVFDGGGGGKQIADRLRQMGHRVKIVMFGGSTSTTKSKAKGRRAEKDETRSAYRNRRAEMYGNLRKLLNPHGEQPFAIPPDAHLLREELAILPLQYDQEGKMFLPPKDLRSNDKQGHELTLRKMLGRSPDRADSLVLACDGLLSSRAPSVGSPVDAVKQVVAFNARLTSGDIAARVAEKMKNLPDAFK
jgi:hypothetical protein